MGAEKVVLAVPVGPPQVGDRFRDEADEMVCPEQPDVFFTQAEVALQRAALREGLDRIGKALAINAGEARYLVRFFDLRYDYPERRSRVLNASVELNEQLRVIAARFGRFTTRANLD